MFGWADLKDVIEITKTSLECPVKGCGQVVQRQRRTFRREPHFRCPIHSIYISPSTFEYEYEKQNMLWAAPDDLRLWESINGPGVKRESRVARDNSEDAVTWNVFRYLERHGLLGKFVDQVTGHRLSESPRLIYWSYCQQSGEPWGPLVEACKGFGERVERRSEPDLIIEDSKVLVFVENKLLSGNETAPSGQGKMDGYSTGCNAWYSTVFQPSSDFDRVAVCDSLYELLRLWLIGSWIANQSGKRFCFVNLVRAETESDIEGRFGRHIQTSGARRFTRWTWEQVCSNIVSQQAGDAEADRLMSFFQNKTLGYGVAKVGNREQGQLRRAFLIGQEGRFE